MGWEKNGILNAMAKTKWKKPLLSSSLPIEHVVASTLSKMNFISWGEFAYIRKDERFENKEFTIDLNSLAELREQSKPGGLLDLLIECKYTHQGNQWVFIPQANNTEIESSVIGWHDGLTGKVIQNKEPLFRFENNIPNCIRGVNLHPGSFDSKTISKAINQLRYALPHLLFNNLSLMNQVSFSEDLNILFYVGMVVTNAPLFVLNDDLSLDDIYKSNDLGEIANEVSAVSISRDSTPLNIEQGKNLANELLNDDSTYKIRYQTFYNLLGNGSKYQLWLPSQKSIERELITAGDTVLIVSLHHLPEIIEQLIANTSMTLNGVTQLFDIRPIDNRNSEQIKLCNDNHEKV